MTSDTSTLAGRIETLSSTQPTLPAFVRRAARAVPSSAEGQRIEMIVDALEHEADIAGDDLRPAWDALGRLLEAHAGDTELEGGEVPFLADALRFKALTMIALNRVRDYTDMSQLITKASVSGVITVLSAFDDDAESPDGLPLTTILVRRLGTVRPRKRASIGTGVAAATDPTAEQWAETTARCHGAAALMISGVAGEIREWTADDIAAAIDTGGLDDWRSILTTIGDDPWCPIAQHLHKAIPDAADKGAATALREALQSVRKRVEAEEHQDVAERVTGYIASTGLTQRAFAARIGTSPSRLSTYANGSVTPSAAMMLRIAKVSAHLTAARS